MVFAIVLLVLLALSVLFNMTQFAGSLLPDTAGHYVQTAGPKLDEIYMEDAPGSSKIAIIEVEGIISSQMREQGGFNMVDVIQAEFRRAANDAHVKAVILKVDSPGGEVLASDEISRIIADFQDRTDKPVIAAMGDLAASGGYYVSAPCRWIVANELTLTGSIGVIISSYNYRGLMNKVGVQPNVYKSGKFKDMLSPAREPDSITEEEREMLQTLVNQTYAKFTNVVVTGRMESRDEDLQKQGRSLRHDWADYADGRILSGKDAYGIGLVDELGNFKDAVRRAKKLANITQADLVLYQQRYDLGDLFRLFGKANTGSVKVDLGFEPRKLRSGQLYFLSPLFVQ
jgi:protease-4